VIRNNDDKPRVVVVEHTLRPGWKLVDTPDPAETSAGLYRFRVEAKPKTTTQLVVQESNPVETTYRISDVDEDDMTQWVTEKSLDAATEKALREVIRRQTAIAEQTNKIEALATEKTNIEKDQSRLRDNLSRLNPDHKDETALRQRYIRQMEEQEDRLAQIKSETQKLQDAVDKAQRSLDEYIQGIAIGN
jgi:chromosome segregation ATPase